MNMMQSSIISSIDFESIAEHVASTYIRALNGGTINPLIFGITDYGEVEFKNVPSTGPFIVADFQNEYARGFSEFTSGNLCTALLARPSNRPKEVGILVIRDNGKKLSFTFARVRRDYQSEFCTVGEGRFRAIAMMIKQARKKRKQPSGVFVVEATR